MAWTAPRTWVAAEITTAVNLNTHVRDNMLWLGTRKGFKIRRAAAQSITTASVTAISFDTEDSDTDAFGSVTATTYTIPSGLDGLYSITALVSMASATLGTAPFVRIIAGGSTFDSAIAVGVAGVGGFGITMPLVSGNTIGVSVFQNSGGSVNTSAVTLWANFVGR